MGDGRADSLFQTLDTIDRTKRSPRVNAQDSIEAFQVVSR
jgi:hypothetical protein